MEAATKRDFPLVIEDVEPDINEKLLKYFHGEHSGFVRVGPKRYIYPMKYRDEAHDIYNMPLRDSDIFVASYPRSGTTWTQEMVWMIANDLDYAGSNAVPLTDRFPFLEFSIFVHPKMKAKFEEENSHSKEKLTLLKTAIEPAIEPLRDAPSPRFIKTHLSMSMLPPTLLDTARVVYVARDPRDVAVSFYNLTRLIRTHDFVGDFKSFWNLFINDLNHHSPFFGHLKEAWDLRHHPRMLFLFYEDLSKDLAATVRRVSEFFNKQFTDAEVVQLCDHLSIENFKKNKSVNYNFIKELKILNPDAPSFIRKGKAGGWREYFDEEMTQQAEQWIQHNLKDTDLRFPHLEQN